MTDDERFMWVAFEEARQCGVDVPIGCVVVRCGQVIARGQNVRERQNDPAGHAEVIALRAAAAYLGSWRLEGCTVYCTLEPCPMCAEAILQSRVQRLVFGAHDLVYGAVGGAFNLYTRSRTFPLPEVSGGVLEQACRQLVKDFFRRRRGDECSNTSDAYLSRAGDDDRFRKDCCTD